MSPNMAKVADIIARHLPESRLFDTADRAESIACDLHDGGLLPFGPHRPPQPLPVQERAAAVLQCRLEWGPAERIAVELAEAGLLRADA
jgi:hypothetical protein